MKVRTAELTGAALDWAVARLEGVVSDDIDDFFLSIKGEFAYSTDWNLGGPIVARELIDIYHVERCPMVWMGEKQIAHKYRVAGYASSALVAAMRCYVRARLGEEVEIPEDLCTTDSG